MSAPAPREELQAAQHRSELHFRRLLDKLPAGAYTCDTEGLITYFNPHAVRIWGRAPKLNDPMDRFCGSFKLIALDGTPVPHSRCWMALALTDDKEYNGYEIVIQQPEGQRVTVLAHVNPIRDEHGRLLGAVNVLVDITERKRTEDLLKEADRSKNELLAMLAHELRNPLAPIRNAVQLLQLKGSEAPELQWARQVIDRQLRQMTRLIDDLLDLARVNGNKLELRKERVELADVLQTAIETSRPLIEASGQELAVTFPPRPISLDGDPARLAQVISNLLNNAAKFTPRDGHIWLTAEAHGSEAVVSVRDSGIGISGEMLPRIFEMFTQVGQALDRSQGGLGIGLTLAKRLVEMHGGTITASSDGPGLGSELTVRLPVIAGTSDAVHPPARDRATPVLPLRILVVDDNRDAAESLGMLLGIMGADIHTAHDGLEAVAKADELRPGVVLLDIGLPKMNGYDAARAIRQQPWGQEIALIALTGWGQEEDRLLSKEAGFDHHLVKPVDFSALLDLLQQTASRQAL